MASEGDALSKTAKSIISERQAMRRAQKPAGA